MKYLLDTDTCIHLLNGGHAGLAKKIAAVSATDVAVSSVVWFELMFGAAKSSRRSDVEQRLRTFARQIEVLAWNAAAAEAAATVRAELEQAGSPIGSFDTLIAGHALTLAATLVTHNIREFKRVRGLRMTDWVTGPVRT